MGYQIPLWRLNKKVINDIISGKSVNEVDWFDNAEAALKVLHREVNGESDKELQRILFAEETQKIVQSFYKDESEVVAHLLIKGVITPDFALLMASRFCSFSCVDVALSAGANPGARDIDGTTALILLVASIEEARDVYLSSRLRILNFLIDQGADINGRGFMGRTVLMLSVRACASIDFVAKLLEHGADVNILCDQGKTALHYAQKPDIADASMSVEYTKLLVKCGANYNDRDEVGFSPLILAILSKNEDVVQFITKLQCRSLSAFIYKEVYFFRIDLIQVYGYVSQDGADLYDVLTQEVSQSGSGYFTIKDLQANEEHMISMDWNGNIQKIRQVSGECFEWGIVSEPPLQQGNPDQSIALVRVRGNAVLFFNENGVLIGERRFGPRWALTPANYINQDETFKISGKGAVRIQGTAILLLTLANIHLTQEGTLDGLLSYGEPAVIDLFEGSGNFECNVDISLSERADIAVVIHRPEGDNKGTIRLKDKQWIAC